MFLEGSPDPNIEALLADAADDADFAAPVGTIWSWPQKNQRFSVRASSELFVRLSEAAADYAEPEICSHVHFYRGQEALVQWLTPSQIRFLCQSRWRASMSIGSRRPLAVPCRMVLPNIIARVGRRCHYERPRVNASSLARTPRKYVAE
jgi:hypothetical protein